MARFFNHFLLAGAERRRAWRRRRNLRVPSVVPREDAARAPSARTLGLVLLAVTCLAVGAATIIGHARHLGAATITTADAASANHAASLFQATLPGATIIADGRPGVRFTEVEGGGVVSLTGMQGMGTVRVDLCTQLRGGAGARLLPLRLGYRFEDVQRWMAKPPGSSAPAALRNVLLVGGESAATARMPEVRISGNARREFSSADSEPLQLAWDAADGGAGAGPQVIRWLSDASGGRIEQGGGANSGFRQQGWLSWGENAALRIERRSSTACPQAGELLVQLYEVRAQRQAGANVESSGVLVSAFPARGAAVNGYLQPGVYKVPVQPRPELEDQTLFDALQASGLVKLDAGGMIAVAPRDLPLWRDTDASSRASELAEWKGLHLDKAAIKVLKRLYQQADGEYVRQQIDVYNSERRLLAWRVQSGPAWQASAGAVPLAATGQMPGAAARLFAELPQGWQPWSRVAYWPQAGGDQTVRLILPLTTEAAAAQAGEARVDAGHPLQLLVAGRVTAVSGARAAAHAACTGRGCTAPSDVTQLTLQPEPGARAITITVQPLDITAMGAPGDQQYRHLRVAAGRMSWQALENASVASSVRARPATQVQLLDRNGTLLWADGAASPAAQDAGLTAMLGVGPEHASSIAGMLARVPSSAGAGVIGKLTLDLPMQNLSQRLLDCIGMRRGRWDGKDCVGGQPAPPGRHAGFVVLDAETGDILAAAGAGNPAVSATNWTEVRDFDRANPARSPLRLPALQHDGGAHRSPGSTFKIVSALGLELAAKSDPQLDQLLGGMSLSAINAMARRRGFAFQTGAATYPAESRAHITNYKEQSLDRRAQEGKLGLAQALTYSLNTWFAWSSELSDRSLFGRPDGGVPGLQALEAGALDPVRPIAAAAHRLGFEQALRLDSGLLPDDFAWSSYDALQATPAHMDAIQTRHELRQMAIGLRMQATPLQMALISAAIGQGQTVAPRLLLELNGKAGRVAQPLPLEIRLDRIRAGMKGVVDAGTAATAFSGPALAQLRRGLYGKTGTAPVNDSAATVWFTGWLEPNSLPSQPHRIAVAAFVSHSDASGGAHVAPMVAALLSTLSGPNGEQKGK